MKLKKLVLSAVIVFPLLASCGKKESGKKAIYTSFYPIYDFAKRIVKDKYSVYNLTPVGVEPHDYEPTAKDVVGLNEAAAVFVNGLGLEHWGESLPKEIHDKTYRLSEGVETLEIEGVKDPHIWLNPLNAVKEMENILSALKSIDSSNYSYYEANYKEAKKEFEALDKELEEIAKSLNNKYLVVSHAAFGYLAKRYGLTQIYVHGLSPDEEPSAKALESIIQKVKDYHISTIFYEELVSSAISEKIAKETGVLTATLNPLEGLDEDELKTEDYLSIMRDNFAKIKKADK